MTRSKVPVQPERRKLFGIVGAAVLLAAVALIALPGGTVAQKATNSVRAASRSRTDTSSTEIMPAANKSWDAYKTLVARNPFEPLVKKSDSNGANGKGAVGMLPPLSVDVVPRANSTAQANSGWAFVGTVGMDGKLYALLENRKQGLGGYYRPGDETPLGTVESVSTEFVRIGGRKGPVTLALTSGDAMPGAKPPQPATPVASQDEQLLQALAAIAGQPADSAGPTVAPMPNLGQPQGPGGFRFGGRGNRGNFGPNMGNNGFGGGRFRNNGG
jgi:hypothetical protein